VEDDEGLNHLIRKALTREGYKTQQALTGSEAIASLNKDPNKILLLDYLLPDMTGKQVVRAVREEKLDVPFIIMTGHGDEKIAVDLMKQGVRDYVVKESGFIDNLPNILRRVSNELATEKELARVEKALRLATKEWQMTFDGISDAICLLDPEMKITQCNNAMSKFLGKKSHEIIGKPCFELVHCTKGPIEDCPLVRMKKTKQREQKVLNVEEMWLDIVAHPLLDEKGVLIGAVHVISDITERKQAVNALQESRDYLEKLTDSHESEWRRVMNIIDAPLGGGQILHFGTAESAAEHKRVINAWAEFSLRYMKEKGWGEYPTKISIQQLLEIRAQPEWKNPKP